MNFKIIFKIRYIFNKMKSFNTILRSENETARNQTKQLGIDDNIKQKKSEIDINIPIQFDGISIWNEYLSEIKNQGDCGACYAIASTSCLADRFALLTNGQVKVDLSSYLMVVCNDVLGAKNLDDFDRKLINNTAHSSGACQGNTIQNACTFLYTYGTLESSCFNKNYLRDNNINLENKISQISQLPYCSDLISSNFDKCTDNITFAKFYRCLTYYNIPDDINDIKREIYRFGPVITGMTVYQSFLDFDGYGIYLGKKEGEHVEGGHSIKIVGWGTQDGIDYWQIANSWGVNFGMNGYFKIKMGVCDIEKNVSGLIPDIKTFNTDIINYSIVDNKDLLEKRIWFGIDNLTGYRYIDIDKIDFPKMLYNIKYLPNFETFLAGNTESHVIPQFYYILNDGHFFWKSVLILIILPLILSYIYRFFNKKK